MALALNEDRIRAVYQGWETAKAASAAGSIASLFAVVGDQTAVPENSRLAGLIQFVLAAPKTTGDVAVLVTADSLVLLTPRPDTEIAVVEGSLAGKTVKVLRGSDKFEEFAAQIPEGSLGQVEKELAFMTGTFADQTKAAVDAKASQKEDAATIISLALANLDTLATDSIKKAAALANAGLRKYVVPELESALTGNPVAMSTFSTNITERLANPTLLPGLENMAGAEEYAPAFAPAVVNSNGRYDCRTIQGKAPSAEILGSDCVVIAYGSKHCGNIGYLARTMMVEANCPKNTQAMYEYILAISNKVIELLKPDAKLADVYAKARAYAEELNPEWVAYLTPSLGSATGIVANQIQTMINAKSVGSVSDGMAFIVRVGLIDVPVNDDGKNVSLLLGDTILMAGGQAVLITKAKRDTGDVVYKQEEEAVVEHHQRDLSTITRAGKKGTNTVSAEEHRARVQASLLEKKATEFAARGGKRDMGQEEREELLTFEVGRLAAGEVRALSNSETPSAEPFTVDERKKCVYLPSDGAVAVFHASTISRSEVRQDSTGFYLVIGFLNTLETNAAYKMNRTQVFVKEMTFYSKTGTKLGNFSTRLNELIRVVKAADTQRKARSGLADTSGRIDSSSNPPFLKKVKVRPAPTTGRNAPSVGDLEAHKNGFIFKMIGQEPLKIFYNNVKNAIFQPSNNDLHTIFHLTLKAPIMVGKKKATEVQFVVEVKENSEALHVTRRTHEQEVAAENAEREMIAKTNREFFAFAKKAEEASDKQISIELPMHNFEFEATHSRSMTKFRGNERVLWALNELPFFTMRLNEIEISSFERVISSGKNFDISFIPISYKAPTQITNCSMQTLDTVKDYLCASLMVYVEGGANIAWNQVLKTIKDDKDWEPWGEEGWRTMVEDEEDEESDDSDDSWDSDDEESSDGDDSDSDWAEEVTSDDEPDTSDDDDSDSGLDWDEMERRAEAEDDDVSDTDSDRPAKRKARK